MKVEVSWGGMEPVEGSTMRFEAVTESGHTLSMDGAPAAAPNQPGGNNLAARPMEMVLAGTGGCTAYDVVLILRRSRAAVHGCKVTLTAERAPTDPKVFTKIHFHFEVHGESLQPEAVERAVKLSHEKYCSASAMLAKTAVMSTSIEIIDTPAR